MSCSRDQLLSTLEGLAPLCLAEPWDNVGLLMDLGERREFERAFFTIDLTDRTLDEALAWHADFLIAYHPPIFGGLKRLRHDVPGERVVLRALRAGLTVYSPHTALDAVEDGMAEWLARALGAGTMQPITPTQPGSQTGAGRLVRLDAGLTLSDAIERIKAHLRLEHVRVSRAVGAAAINTLAVCPGAGGSVFEQVGAVDLLLTGEMRHHDVLARSARGTHVVLTDHTHSERAYLPHFARNVSRACPGLSVLVSQTDADPLEVV